MFSFTVSRRYIKSLLILLTTVSLARGLPGKCDQTPPMAAIPTPSEERGIYYLHVQTAGSTLAMKGNGSYRPDQTYVLIIKTSVSSRPFKWFMITAEDPDVDNNMYDSSSKYSDVGSLKTLDTDQKSRYSESCSGSVESADSSVKTSIEIHWVSPKQSGRDQKVRIRATVAENKDSWFNGDNLTIVLYKDNQVAPDSPPLAVRDRCDLCSEARYEVIFNGKWSRMAHPRHYPTKPDENGYSHMVGASHDATFSLWQQGSKATLGMKLLAEDSNVTEIEREIISNMAEKSGTRTLIRGKRRHHPYMSEPSHSLFRVDRYHHMFSIAVAMRPSPDWFLGTSRFELCTADSWLQSYEIPLYPWDAGTMDGVSYESQKSSTKTENIERIELGSFNRESPFYQMNLNDLKPFATLTVRRLNVYPLTDDSCSQEDSENEENNQPQEEAEEEESQDEPQEPLVMESKVNTNTDRCYIGEWGAWSPCISDEGGCGSGFKTRTRHKEGRNIYLQNDDSQDNLQTRTASNCEGDQDAKLVEYQKCFVNCY